MPRAKVSDAIELEYDVRGDAGAPPLVLVMGFSLQMVAWDEAFCDKLASRGFRVFRYDNRDVGLSTKLSHLGPPDFMRAMMGDTTAAPYSIEDMAGDLVGLLDALGLPAAHVAGVSMGGFIVQSAAIARPERILSLASIMSTTGDRAFSQPTPRALQALLAPVPTERARAIDHAVSVWKVLGSQTLPFDEARVRADATRAWDRSHDAEGVARQACAVFTQTDRTAALGKVSIPSVVIHGVEDPLLTLPGGEATARAIPGARMVAVHGMGHDLPPQVWDVVIDAIVDNARRAMA